MHAQPPACLESTQSVHRVLKALKNVLRVTLSLYKLSLTLIIKKLKMPKSTQFGPENTVGDHGDHGDHGVHGDHGDHDDHDDQGDHDYHT